MLNLKKIVMVAIVLALAASITFNSITFATNPTPPTPFPSIFEISRTHPDWLIPRIRMTQVPESEMVYILFDKEWLYKNDTNPDPGTVKITFPTNWVQHSKSTVYNTSIIELSIPKKLLDDNNESISEDEITVTFPNSYFTGLPIPLIPPAPKLPDQAGGVIPRDIEYFARIYYGDTPGPNLTGARGSINISYFNNPSGESFHAFHEIENYATTGADGIEVIAEYYTYLSSTKVFFGVWNNNEFFMVDTRSVSVPTSINYEWYINGTQYAMYFNIGSGWYYAWFSDSTPPTDFYSFTGSSEFDTIGGLNGHAVTVITSPMSIKDLKTTSWQGASYVNSRLQYNYSTDMPYVAASSTKNTSGLFFYLYGGSSY